MNNPTLTADLRALADYLDAHPVVTSEVYAPEVYVLPLFAERWAAVLADMGSFTKSSSAHQLCADRMFGSVKLHAIMDKSDTCERVQVGETAVETRVYPDDVEPEMVTTMEPIYEWKCPESWMSS